MCMDDKEILRRVIQGFQLVPAKQGFGHPYVTKTGAATSDLSKRINAWIKQNFPQSNIMTSYEGVYKTINFRRVMAEHLIVKQLVRETIEEARSQSATRKVRDVIVASDSSHIKPAQKSNRVFAPDLSTEDLINKIKTLYKTDVKVIEPKQVGSESSKFPTLEFNVDGNDIKIVHAKGIVAGAEGESKQETSISNQLQAKGKPITLEVVDTRGKKHLYNNIDGFRKIAGNKKADFAFTSKGVDKLFIQHKSPIHQQMSGITKFERADYPEIDSFINKVSKMVQSSPTGRLDKPVSQVITDPKLKTLAVYGDQNNIADSIQVYCIGDLGLQEKGEDKMQLTADKIYVYPEIPEGSNAPILGATYRKDRNQYGIPNVRFGIYPASYIKGSE
jgi:hypothetical protein